MSHKIFRQKGAHVVMKNIKKSFAAMMVFALAIVLFACSSTKESEPEKVYQLRITFDAGSGATVDPEYVEIDARTLVPEPNATKEGYQLEGWYMQNTFERKWNFETDIVYNGLTLYAKWEPIA